MITYMRNCCSSVIINTIANSLAFVAVLSASWTSGSRRVLGEDANIYPKKCLVMSSQILVYLEYWSDLNLCIEPYKSSEKGYWQHGDSW